jgi:crotonobetainyl-CoA:carnitine CoA-transferase CaiB-like acyl-CoA transferase
MAGPLAGVRVLECAQIMAGPTCGALLADLGADVIKVERVPGGDDARAYREPRIGGVSAPFLVMNRNKRGIALDFKRPEGRDALLRLADSADVLVENDRPGTLERLGLGWDVLHARRPSLIYCSISGYGSTGPMGGGGGFDLVAQAFAGLMSITGEPGRPPAKVGSSVADLNAGLLASSGILAAYIHRLKTGEGQRVDTSLMEAALHQTDWKRDPRFAEGSRRMANLPALVEAMETALGTRDSADWLADFGAAGVPAGPVHSIGEALSHPQTLARGMVVDLEHPVAGPTRALGPPVKLSATPTYVGRHAPSLGEHTREVLREHGWADAEIDALLASGAAIQAD